MRQHLPACICQPHLDADLLTTGGLLSSVSPRLSERLDSETLKSTSVGRSRESKRPQGSRLEEDTPNCLDSLPLVTSWWASSRPWRLRAGPTDDSHSPGAAPKQEAPRSPCRRGRGPPRAGQSPAPPGGARQPGGSPPGPPDTTACTHCSRRPPRHRCCRSGMVGHRACPTRPDAAPPARPCSHSGPGPELRHQHWGQSSSTAGN